MKLFLRKNIFFIFWGIVLLDLISVALRTTQLVLILKPLLMPSLIVAVLSFSPRSAGRKKILIALFFSFLGDTFLLFQDKYPLFFILGLSCFLATHIFYIAYFIQLSKNGASISRKYPYLIAVIAAYTGALLYLLMPDLADMKIPVIIYACIISVMLYFSLNIPFRVSQKIRRFFFIGALCFVMSDSLLAINKFYHSFPAADLLIMLTYCVAQYFIVKGFIRNRN